MFKIGQKVVCVDNSELETRLELNKIYSVTGLLNICSCGTCVSVDNHPDRDDNCNLIEYGQKFLCACGSLCTSNGLMYYRPHRFRPLDETFAEDVLAMITEQIEEEELILG